MPATLRPVVVESLTAPALAEVNALVRAATEFDGLHPLSEHVMLHLAQPAAGPDRHVLVYAAGDAPGKAGERLAGYAHLDPTDVVQGASAELVVHPDLRGQGVGRLLAEQLQELAPDGRLRLWAHGQSSPGRSLAASLGYVSSRELWQMRRSLHAELPSYQAPQGYTLRTFRPGLDDDAWIAVNAAAFADHPEQGNWTVAELHHRMAEEWFDPAGFFLLEHEGNIAGFHWTKVHGDGSHGHEPIGEVYVVGVAPGHQGHGLGRSLTVAGLRHLRSLGLRQAMLYVDADNAAAVRTYSQLGFTRWDVDVQFSRPLTHD